MLSLEEIGAAAKRIAPFVRETPVAPLTPSGLRVKAENLQPIGAFKVRGAFNAILSLPEQERRRGVVAHSSGNHGQAVAYAAKVLGIPAAIVMPGAAPKVKIEATRYWGAEIHLVDIAGRARAEKCAELARSRGYCVIEPYDALSTMAGAGTIGLEILRQFPGVWHVFVPVSGGGLIGGVSTAIAQSAPDVNVIGVEPELAADARESFLSGSIQRIEPELTQRTIADGLRVPQLGVQPFAHIRAHVRDIVTVSEAEIRNAMRRIAREARLIAEPSGAVAIAGAFKADVDLQATVAVLSGGNVDPDFYASVLTQGDE